MHQADEKSYYCHTIEAEALRPGLSLLNKASTTYDLVRDCFINVEALDFFLKVL